MGSPIKLLCENICSPNGCTYWVSRNISSEILWDKECEQGWYCSGTLEFLGDPHALNSTKHFAVADLTPEKMTSHHCLDVYHLVRCDQSGAKYNHTYHVLKSQLTTLKPSASSVLKNQLPTLKPPSSSSGVIVGLVLGLLLVLAFLAFLFVRKWKEHRSNQEIVERQHHAEPTQSATDSTPDVRLNIPLLFRSKITGQLCRCTGSNQDVMDGDQSNKITARDCNGGPPNLACDCNGGPPHTARDCNEGPPHTARDCNGGPPNSACD